MDLGFDGDEDVVTLNGNDWGHDEIWGFDDGTDLIRIANVTEAEFDAGDVVISDDGPHTSVEWNGNLLTLLDIDHLDVTKDDFLFL